MTWMPSKKTGRLMPYIEAIVKARAFGYSWEDLRSLFNEQGFDIAKNDKSFRQTFVRAKKQYDKAEYKADQLPLPGQEATESSRTEANQEEQKSQSGTMGNRKRSRSTQHQGIKRPGDAGFKGKT